MSAREEELAQQLTEVNARFDDWKARARAGVEKQKAALVELTEANATLVSENETLLDEVEGLKKDAEQQSPPADLEQAPCTSCPNAEQLLDKHAAYAAVMGETAIDALCVEHDKAATLSGGWKAAFAASQAAAELVVQQAEQGLGSYKKRAEMTIKLLSKDQDAVRGDLAKAADEVTAVHKELQDAQNGVKQRDIAIAALEERLDEALGELHEIHNAEGNAEGRAAGIEEALQGRLREIEVEYDEREQRLLRDHRDELDRVGQRHESEAAALRDSVDDRVEMLLKQAQEQNHTRPVAQVGGDANDAGYTQLLDENAQLKRTLDAAVAERYAAKEETAVALEKLARYEGPRANESGVADSDPAVMRRKIRDLERQVKSVSEQLWAASQQLIDLRAASGGGSASRDAGPGRGGEAAEQHQQLAYTKAVLVKMLCAQTDAVRGSLMPVVSAVLKFSTEELKTIYSANPNWVR